MLTGAEIAKLGRWSLCLLLVGCGGRTLDDGIYEADGASSDGAICVYRGNSYADGSPVDGVCFCFCDHGRIECEPGCSSPSGGATSSGGTSGSGTTIFGGATSSGGTTSTAGSGTTGATGGTIGAGATAGSGVASGGVATAGSTGVGGQAGGAIGGGTTGGFGGGMPLMCSPTAPIATGLQPLIDSMDDGDIYISPLEGRSGSWFVYNDGSSTGFQQPTPPTFYMDLNVQDPSGGNVVANTFGKGFSSWGAGMGFVFNNGCSYNAKVYSGITFYARSEIGPTSIYVLVGTSATTPIDAGGACSGVCYDAFQLPIGLDRDWQKYTIAFSALTQQGWGTPAFFDRTTLVNVNFQTIPGGANGAFSFSVDSISFY